MSRIKNTLAAFGIFFALFVCASATSYAQGAKPPSDVNVVNTPSVKIANTSANPVPTQAQGTTNVAGTVQAQQSGDWTVGIAGTPTVNLAQGASLSIGNTAANPVLARDVDNPAKQPFQARLDSSNPNNTSFQVPPGKRLVIEYVSAASSLPAGQKLLTVELLTQLNVNQTPSGILHFFTPTFTGRDTIGRDIFVVSQQTRLYAEPGTSVALEVTATAGGPVVVSVVGYLVDVE